MADGLAARLFVAALFAVALGGPLLSAAAQTTDVVTWTCRHGGRFTALETDNAKTGNMFVTRKSTGKIKDDCMVETRPSDIVVGRDEPYYYIDLRHDYLVLDSGTGPDRSLVIFDLRSGKPILQAPYSVSADNACDPTRGCLSSEEFKLDDSGVIFWRATKEPPTARNCPDFAKISRDLPAVIEEKTAFRFATRKAENLKTKRCVPSQGGYSGGLYKINGIAQD